MTKDSPLLVAALPSKEDISWTSSMSLDSDGSSSASRGDWLSVPVYKHRSARRKNASIYVLLCVVLAFVVIYQLHIPPFNRTTSHTRAGDGNREGVDWQQCTGPHEGLTRCAVLSVPLDYFDPSAGLAQIALAKYPATKLPRKGSILFNPGGPGGQGKQAVAIVGSYLQQLLGAEYDIVGFDPRGIGETKPQMKCFTGRTSFADFKRNTILQRSYDLSSNMSTDEARKILIAQHKEADALYRTQFSICNNTMGETLKYMGTSTVVRDIDYITKHLEGEEALINFFGGSYGSILGQYIVSMLPDRVGKVAIDGIADAATWAGKPYYLWYRDWLSSTNTAYDIFTRRCSQVGPLACALALEKGEEPSKIRDRIENFVDALYYQPLPVDNSIEPGILTSGRVRKFLLGALQSPGNWPAASVALEQAMHGDGSAILNALVERDADLARSGVSCNDNLPFASPDPQVVVDELLDVFQTVSRLAFSVVTSEPDAGCQYWPGTPPEQFQGPWNRTLRNPILIISNTADPVTPLRNGKVVRDRLGNSSRLLIQNSPGHTTFSMFSRCTVDLRRRFYSDGTLPEDDTICQSDAEPFPDTGFASNVNEPMAEAVYMVDKVIDLTRRGQPLDRLLDEVKVLRSTVAA